MFFAPFLFLSIVWTMVCTTQSNPFSVPPRGNLIAYSPSFYQEEWQLVQSNQSYVPDVCSPVHISSSIRHGSRFPTLGSINQLRDFADKVRGNIQSSQYAELNETVILYREEDQNLLVPLGRKEMRDQARRMVTSARFGSLLSAANPEELVYFSSDTNRTIESAVEWQAGLGEGLGDDMTQPIDLRNDIIRFFDTCPKWTESIEQNDTAMEEYIKFQSRSELITLAQTLTKRLELQGEPLTVDDIKAAWILAATQKMVDGESAWEKLFTWDEMDVLQYSDDLMEYLTGGYGYKLSHEMSCELLSDMVDSVQRSKLAHEQGQQSWNKGLFRFGHHFTNRPLQTLFGLYKDEVPLASDNYEYQQLNRQFRSDRTIPMSSAVTLALYACDVDSEWTNTPPPGVEWPAVVEPYMVQLITREVPHKFPFCSTHFCSYEQFLSYYEPTVSTCDFDTMCGNI